VVRADRFVYENAKNATGSTSGNGYSRFGIMGIWQAMLLVAKMLAEGWDNPGDLQQAAADCVGPNIPPPGLTYACRLLWLSRMWRIPGYHHSCEYPDLLHCLYLGTVREATASHVMELATYSPQLQAYETWDERLHHLHGDFQMWCKEHQFRPSLLDGLSLIKLGVDAVSLDYPLGPGKGWANRVLIAYLADRLSALSESVPELRLAAVNTWSITAFANLLDNCPIWLTDDQAILAQQNPCCIVVLHAACSSQLSCYPAVMIQGSADGIATRTKFGRSSTSSTVKSY
ncbi:unnamed protein product, partial [Symbiodinium necroappetens]